VSHKRPNHRLGEGEGEAQVTIERLYTLIGPQVTRIPVFNTDGSLSYLAPEGGFLPKATRRYIGIVANLDLQTMWCMLSLCDSG
jgi:hypothetical protein